MEPEIHCRSTILQPVTLIGALSVRRKGMFLWKSERERFLEGEEETLALAEDVRPLGSRYQSHHHPAIGKAHLVQYPSNSPDMSD